MKIKTSGLTDLALDYAVAWCLGMDEETLDPLTWVYTAHPSGGYDYSTNWALAGPIIEQELICIERNFHSNDWTAWTPAPELKKGEAVSQGHTPLVAAMRCYVASRLGDEVNVPDSLMCENEVADEGTARLITVTMALTCDSDAQAIDTILCNVSTYQEGDAFQNGANHAGN